MTHDSEKVLYLFFSSSLWVDRTPRGLLTPQRYITVIADHSFITLILSTTRNGIIQRRHHITFCKYSFSRNHWNQQRMPSSDTLSANQWFCHVQPTVSRKTHNKLRVIWNGFSQNWWKVVSSCLLQHKPICLLNLDKMRHKMLKSRSLVVFLV